VVTPVDPVGDSINGNVHGGGPLGATLEPIVRAACGGRLSPVTWFRTDWQRGGAATGYATFTPAGEGGDAGASGDGKGDGKGDSKGAVDAG
ncbi:hypothetical protein R0K19_23525, partial [Bacillus sp. SIMBA_161]